MRSEAGHYPKTYCWKCSYPALQRYITFMLYTSKKIIVSSSLCILPAPVHLVSYNLIILTIILYISLFIFSNFPLLFSVLKFYVPILILSPLSTCSNRMTVWCHLSYIAIPTGQDITNTHNLLIAIDNNISD